MTERRFLMPHYTVRIIEPDGRASREWRGYLSGIETIGSRVSVAGALDDLAGAATLADVITQLNALTAALRGE